MFPGDGGTLIRYDGIDRPDVPVATLEETVLSPSVPNVALVVLIEAV